LAEAREQVGDFIEKESAVVRELEAADFGLGRL
jgi:hypothetical protein